MLAVCQDVVLIKMFQETAGKDMFLDLAAYTSHGNWLMMARLVLFVFLELSCDIGTPPIFWYSSCIKALLKYDEVWCSIISQLIYIHSLTNCVYEQ